MSDFSRTIEIPEPLLRSLLETANLVSETLNSLAAGTTRIDKYPAEARANMMAGCKDLAAEIMLTSHTILEDPDEEVIKWHEPREVLELIATSMAKAVPHVVEEAIAEMEAELATATGADRISLEARLRIAREHLAKGRAAAAEEEDSSPAAQLAAEELDAGAAVDFAESFFRNRLQA